MIPYQNTALNIVFAFNMLTILLLFYYIAKNSEKNRSKSISAYDENGTDIE
jgi:hypothetical protein